MIWTLRDRKRGDEEDVRRIECQVGRVSLCASLLGHWIIYPQRKQRRIMNAQSKLNVLYLQKPLARWNLKFDVGIGIGVGVGVGVGFGFVRKKAEKDSFQS